MPEVLKRLLVAYPDFAERLAGKPHRSQVQATRRLVRRVERRDECLITKRHGGVLYLKLDALESLVPEGADVLTAVEKNLSDLHRSHRELVRRVNGHGSVLRVHGQDLKKLAQKQRETQLYLAKLNTIDQE